MDTVTLEELEKEARVKNAPQILKYLTTQKKINLSALAAVSDGSIQQITELFSGKANNFAEAIQLAKDLDEEEIVQLIKRLAEEKRQEWKEKLEAANKNELDF